MNNIDLILYINLDKREDRRREIEEEFKKMNIPLSKITRIPAIYRPNGAVGCTLSHIKALTSVLHTDDTIKSVLVLEDDFTFTDDHDLVQTSIRKLFETYRDDWDVVLLSYYVKKRKAHLQSTLLSVSLDAGRTDGYLVRKSYIPKLLENYYESSLMLEQTGMHWIYAIDMYWSRLMEKDQGRWLYFIQPLGYQRESYSDLERVVTCNRSRVSTDVVTI